MRFVAVSRLKEYLKKWLPFSVIRSTHKLAHFSKTLHRELALACKRYKEPPMSPPTPLEAALIDRLRSSIASLPVLTSSSPSECEKVWNKFRQEIRSYILGKDPRTFLTWDVTRQTMVATDYHKGLKAQLRSLRASDDWHQRWRPALVEGQIGSPSPCTYYVQSSARDNVCIARCAQ